MGGCRSDEDEDVAHALEGVAGVRAVYANDRPTGPRYVVLLWGERETYAVGHVHYAIARARGVKGTGDVEIVGVGVPGALRGDLREVVLDEAGRERARARARGAIDPYRGDVYRPWAMPNPSRSARGARSLGLLAGRCTPARGARCRQHVPRVLLVDDEDDAGALVSLARPEIDVRVAADGAAALDALERTRSFDLVVCRARLREVYGPVYRAIWSVAPELKARTVLLMSEAALHRLRAEDGHARPVVDDPLTRSKLETALLTWGEWWRERAGRVGGACERAPARCRGGACATGRTARREPEPEPDPFK